MIQLLFYYPKARLHNVIFYSPATQLLCFTKGVSATATLTAKTVLTVYWTASRTDESIKKAEFVNSAFFEKYNVILFC